MPLALHLHKITLSVSFQTAVVFVPKTSPLLQIAIPYLELGNKKQ